MSWWVEDRTAGALPRYQIGRGRKVGLPLVRWEDQPSRARARKVAEGIAAAAEHEATRTGIDGKGPKTTVDQMWELFRPGDILATKPDSQLNRLSVWENHVQPQWGRRTIGSIQAVEVQHWVDHTLAPNMSPSTAAKAITVLSKLFDHALFLKRIGVNPVRSVRKPKNRPAAPKAIAELELEALLDTIYCHETYGHWFPLAVFLGTVPVRPGEAAGLQVKHLDLRGNTALICQQWTERHGGMLKPWTKTAGSHRLVPVPADVMELLAESTAGLSPDAFVFVGPDGHNVNLQNFRQRVLKPAAVEAGIEAPVDVYCLRHTAITGMVKKLHGQFNRKELASWAGHRVSTMEDVYVRAGVDFDGSEMAALSGAVTRRRSDPGNVVPIRGAKSV